MYSTVHAYIKLTETSWYVRNNTRRTNMVNFACWGGMFHTCHIIALNRNGEVTAARSYFVLAF